MKWGPDAPCGAAWGRGKSCRHRRDASRRCSARQEPAGNLPGAECRARRRRADLSGERHFACAATAVSLTFSEGTIGFLQAYDGRVTGAVFSGRGHVSANLRDPAEKQSLAHFLGVPLLEHDFSGAYLRFDDGAAEELLDQLRHEDAGPASPKSDDAFADDLEQAAGQSQSRPVLKALAGLGRGDPGAVISMRNCSTNNGERSTF